MYKLEKNDANNNSSDEDSIGTETNVNDTVGVEVNDVNDSVGEGNGDKDGADIASNMA